MRENVRSTILISAYFFPARTKQLILRYKDDLQEFQNIHRKSFREWNRVSTVSLLDD